MALIRALLRLKKDGLRTVETMLQQEKNEDVLIYACGEFHVAWWCTDTRLRVLTPVLLKLVVFADRVAISDQVLLK